MRVENYSFLGVVSHPNREILGHWLAAVGDGQTTLYRLRLDGMTFGVLRLVYVPADVVRINVPADDGRSSGPQAVELDRLLLRALAGGASCRRYVDVHDGDVGHSVNVDFCSHPVRVRIRVCRLVR